MTQFTPQDAEALIATVQTAPLRNMRHAEEVSHLLGRFKAWYERVATVEAAKRAPGRKARQGSPASPPQDPAA